ncbi:DUF2975 domain-containing protein [Chitinophaga polysaccharea]|uniref:DUF2975 domain-containing protein n=1 Tax=Chitinophaga polysaccharea TaxID=1293035 RepID=UPI001158B1C0
MNHTKIISRTLFIVCCILAAGYFATTLYSAFCLLTNSGITSYEVNNYLHINYPFTRTPFINIENNTAYKIFSFLLPLLLYGFFFWLSAKVFRIFFQPRYFTSENIARLRYFYIANLFIPLPVTIVSAFFVEVIAAMWLLVFVHFMLGMFSLLLANIFRQGLNLQRDQDLFI